MLMSLRAITVELSNNVFTSAQKVHGRPTKVKEEYRTLERCN